MKEFFFTLSDKVLETLSKDEHLTVSINGENSQFIRINNAKIRQIGEVSDSTLSLELVKNNRKIGISFTLQRNLDLDLSTTIKNLEVLRKNIDDNC